MSNFEPARYVFSLKSYTIRNTRSRHEDTNFVFATLQVPGKEPVTKSKKMGDQNNGTFDVNFEFDEVPISDAKEKVGFYFVIVNSGHGDPQRFIDAMTATMNKAAKADQAKGEGKDEGNDTDIWSKLAEEVKKVFLELFTLGISLLFADCDGLVARKRYLLSGSDLWNRTNGDAGSKVLISTKHPGQQDESDLTHEENESNAGCGSNSDYSVLWALERRAAQDAKPDKLDLPGKSFLSVGDLHGQWHGHDTKFTIVRVFDDDTVAGRATFTGGPHQGVAFAFGGGILRDGTLYLSRNTGTGVQTAHAGPPTRVEGRFVWNGTTMGDGIPPEGLPFVLRSA